MATYQEIYPSQPLVRSDDQVKPSAASLLSLEYFEAEPNVMPTEVFDQHHILINLKNKPHRVENWRAGCHFDFTFKLNEVVITPAGIESGWRWHEQSKCIVITLDPRKLEAFVHSELGIILVQHQLHDVSQQEDEDLAHASTMLLDSLRQGGAASDVMFESLARIFLVKLVTKYGEVRTDQHEFSASFTARHFKQVLDYIEDNFSKPLQIEDIARAVGISKAHFSRLFKQAVGDSPYQFLMRYRVEQAAKMLSSSNDSIGSIAEGCGFSDQPHLTRLFKQFQGITPRAWRAQNR